MMRNHEEKLKDVAESVLPSRARARARGQRRIIHHRHRSEDRYALVSARRDPDGHDDIGGLSERRRREAIGWMVSDRRDADNLGALLRWARARIEADPALAAAPVEVQVAGFRSVLPDNVIGRHALQHIRWDLTFRQNGRGHRSYRVAGMRRRASERDRLMHSVRVLVATGRHGDLNDAIRLHLRAQAEQARPQAGDRPRRAVHECPRRFLLGADDIAAFAADVARDECVRGIVHRLAGRKE
jgi:hypothetical protein